MVLFISHNLHFCKLFICLSLLSISIFVLNHMKLKFFAEEHLTINKLDHFMAYLLYLIRF